MVSETSPRRRLLVLLICCMSLLIAGMDSTIVNVALPAISRDFHASVSDLQWSVDAYVLVLAGLLMLSGSTADRIGRRRTFQTGLVVFTLGSVLCSVAPNLVWLVSFRMVQAVGGSMLNPVAMSIITNVFVEPRERARAIGVWGGVIGISLGVGPIVGGLLIQSVSWRAIFWINIPIGVATIVLAALFVPESRAARPRRPDPVGQALVLAILVTLTYAIIESPRTGWGSGLIVTMLALATGALFALVCYERRRFQPLLDMRFFRSAPFAGATVTAVCAFGAYAGFLFLNTLYLQDVRGYSAFRAGLCLLPFAASTIVAAPLSGRLVGTRGSRLPTVLAGACIAAGAAMLVPLDANTSLAYLFISYVLFAVGFGFVNAPITNAAVSGMPDSQAGVAAAIGSTSRQVGVALGVAVVGSVLNSGLRGRGIPVAFSVASQPAWWILLAAGCVVLLLGLITTSGWARRTTEHTAHLFEVENAILVSPHADRPPGQRLGS